MWDEVNKEMKDFTDLFPFPQNGAALTKENIKGKAIPQVFRCEMVQNDTE